MKPPVDYLFPPMTSGTVPYWRLTLRGCSQLCFQTNELTGIFFLVAVLVTSPLAAAYMLVAALMAPGGRMLLGQRGAVLETGLPGLNPCLVALSLPAFFETGWTDWGMWAVLVVCVAVAIVLVRVLLLVLPFPILVLPFLIIFWILWALEPHVGFLEPAAGGPAAAATFQPVAAVLRGLGETLFSPAIVSGLLFLCGVLLGNWRHGVIALVGATTGTVVAYYYRQVDPGSADLGLYGFNGVLAAVSAYVVCGGRLRLAVLGAVLATILTPAISAVGVQALSAPFVLTTWFLLLLGWIEDRWFGAPPQPQLAGSAATPAADTQTPLPARNGD
ncbi:urea transporter [Microbaculum marinum]|uniref:Urea transporter n=1 Tax=Microbaculum marinum TaxID=1764581 RepID=A0AAW9RW82_9HYPH